MKPRIALAFALFAPLVTITASARAVPMEQIPSPRPGWAVDLTGTLTPEALRELDRLGDEVKARNGAEIAVVVVGSTDGEQPRAYATRLANAWGIGSAEADNGLLILAALDDRAAEIVLGTGVDSARSRQEADEIMQGEMVPRFRAGDPSGALLQGARACAARILDGSEQLKTGTASYSTAPPKPESAAYLTGEPVRRDAGGAGLLPWLLSLLLGGFGALVYFVARVPRCRNCRIKMLRLDEEADDAHLTPAQRSEERVGSVRHDIWSCQQCGEITHRSSSSFLSGYKDCPQCGARTKASSSTVLEEATYTSGGLVKVDEWCEHCDYRGSHRYSTPRLVRRDDDNWSSSSSGSSSSSSWSSSSSSSSSSSGGSGFGGGSSSGGGASGRW
ncbi:MAG TPA: TPM domain-containing protein [Thermoanaerobaculia bacterium]